MSDYIKREDAVKALRTIKNCVKLFEDSIEDCAVTLNDLATAADVVERCGTAEYIEIPDGGIGEVSDGYHTFNSLYRQRLILTAALVKAHKDVAWKSWRHEDGQLCFDGGWFIVGFDTPDGSYTYHYEEKDWGLFDCVELPVGKHWDGHTDEDVERLLSIPAADVVERPRWISVTDRLPEIGQYVICYSEIHGVNEAVVEQGEYGLIFLDPIEEYFSFKNVSHWMEKPAPPKEDNDDNC